MLSTPRFQLGKTLPAAHKKAHLKVGFLDCLVGAAGFHSGHPWPSPQGQPMAVQNGVVPFCEPSVHDSIRTRTTDNKKGPLMRALFIVWSERPDLNRRPPHPQCGALPGCATLRI
jgi:hypothetical protein